MNEVDAARVMAALHGAFPNTGVDDATISMWANALSLVDYQVAMAAVQRYVETENFWPTIAKFNGVITEMHRESRGTGAQRALMGTAIRCNGSGWFDRGGGQEPCPTCNPWMREQWREGKLNQTLRPPTNYLMPDPCQPNHAGDGPLVTSRARAMQLVIGGLREQLTEDGKTPEEIDEIVARRMPAVMAAVAGTQ